jgi:phosphate starvation-inducible PhoH-like protein
MKKTIQLNGVDPIIFAGANDQNIKIIDTNFDSNIVLRGNKLIVEGAKKDIEKLEILINDILFTINKKGFIDKTDLGILIHSNSTIPNASSDSKVDLENIILHSHIGTIVAQTAGQKKYFDSVKKNDIVFAIGPAGTGKTFQAVACAVSALKNKEVEKIIITRPVVEAGERLGFLPGDLKDKVDPYLTPLYDALDKMLLKDKLKKYIDTKVIEIAPLAYMRGRTLHNSFMILDEAQNSTHMQMKMFLTRLGVTSKAIITGDVTQTDLEKNEISGLIDASKILKKIKGISFIELTEKDVVRHKLVKDIIKAYSKKGK